MLQTNAEPVYIKQYCC